MRDIVVSGSANSEAGDGATRRHRRSSEFVREGTIAEDCRSTHEQVICDALRLAFVATHLRVVWHARAITAERAMQLLDQLFCEMRVRNEGNELTEMTDSIPSYRTTW